MSGSSNGCNSMEVPFFDPGPLDQMQSLLGKEMVADLVDEFVRSGADILARFDRALSEGDAKAAQREAHSLKSSASSLGLVFLARLCAVIEAACRNQRMDEAGGGRDGMAENYAKACLFLRDVKNARLSG
ncbi:hybrid sensory histidine kinase TorS [mine drainage metagenome]|uniref:Hybrid sensory histidine kinase TorS n=1 Tax=mine drainage metagenome TaxID=410659 RepID=A0A1J5SKW9_9ZZZZ